MRTLEIISLVDKEDSHFTCSSAEVATLVRLGAGAALPALGVLANGALIAMIIKIIIIIVIILSAQCLLRS